MKRESLPLLILGAIVVILSLALGLTQPAGGSVTPSAGVQAYNAPVCGSGYVPVDLGHGDYLNVINAPDGSTCVTAERHRAWWYVSSTNGTSGWNYPNISSGIEWGRYTCYDGRSAHPGHGSRCMRYPVREDADGDPVTSISRVWPHLARGNVSYDIWFNRTDVAPDKLGQNDGAEVMIWLQHPGVPIGNYQVLWRADIGGHAYDAVGWTAHRNRTSWLYTAYIAVHPMTSMPATRLNEFFSDAIEHGRLSPSWWLTSVNFGEEILAGGDGFAVRGYSLAGVR